MRASTAASTEGRPVRACGYVHLRRTRRRCQPSRVSGLTPNTGHLDLGSLRLNAARSARSAGRNRGRATCRRRIRSSWRRTRISSAWPPSDRLSKAMNACTLRSPGRQTTRATGALQISITQSADTLPTQTCLQERALNQPRSSFCTPRVGNRFYTGLVVWHPGLPDEEVRSGAHEVPEDIRVLWERCQVVRRRNTSRSPHGVRKHRAYPLTGGLAICDVCETDYYGQGHKERDGSFTRRLHHNRDTRCSARPRSQRAGLLEKQLADGVLADFRLPDGWKALVLKALRGESVEGELRSDEERLTRALGALRRQHLWGDISDEQYKRERDQIRAQLRRVEPAATSLDLDRAEELLSDSRRLWTHPGVTGAQRRDLAHRVFNQVRVHGERIVAVRPRTEYLPLFAAASLRVCSGRGERI